MSGKSLKSIKDENSDLQKQIGCIAGFFQLFDRHRFLTSSHIQQRSSDECSNDIKELNGTMQKATAKNVKVSRENQQFSRESSITSMSSTSCSSSMSSLEFNRTIQTESPSTGQIKVPENQNSELAMKQLDSPGQKSIDLYDIVKDSMRREAQGLSVKTFPKEQKKGQSNTLKHIDSPRPLQSHKSVNARVMVSNESFHDLDKSKKTSWDSPRFSYDGRDTRDTSRNATKHKELARLSLDSREGSARGFSQGNKSRNLLKGPEKGYARNAGAMLNQLQEPDTSRRSSSVVAKLMGLETFPDLTQTCETPPGTSSCSNDKNKLLARSRTSDEYKQSRSSESQRTSQGSSLPRADSLANVTPYSRFALETSPWRQPDESQSSQLQVSKGSDSDVEASKSSPSVYGEIEKRLAELEFKKSGKDLRALKHILEAMQRYKDSSDSNHDHASNSPSENCNNSSLYQNSKVQSPRIQKKEPTSVSAEMSNTSQDSKLPIVIMKTTNVPRKANKPSSTEMSLRGKSGFSKCSLGNPTNGRPVDKQTSKGISSTIRNVKDPYSQPSRSSDKSNNMRTSKSTQSSKFSQGHNGQNNHPCNITVTGSPRLQKKFGLERRSPPSSPSSDSSINRRQHNRNFAELSSSPSTTPRQKFSTLQERNECLGENVYHWRDFKHRVNVIAPDFDRKRSFPTYSDIEVVHIEQSGKIISTSIQVQLSGLNQNIAVENLSKRSKAETIVSTEQPSPVSVLDAAFYRDDPPSPVRKKSDISDDSGEVLRTYSTCDDSEENSMVLPLSNTKKANFNTGSTDRDLNNQNLVQTLQEIDAKLNNFSNSTDPDHKYIAEILVASGLLSGPTISQASQSPIQLINPKLFFALEQTKRDKGNFNIEGSAKKIGSIVNPEQMQRKLIFDVVNDILLQKLMLESSYTLWCLPNELSGRRQKGKHLLDELCTEIDQLQPQNTDVNLANEDENLLNLLWKDLMHHSTYWTNCCCEIPNVVLDIERLIFKDLITEVVRGEAANSAGKHCRQLVFP